MGTTVVSLTLFLRNMRLPSTFVYSQLTTKHIVIHCDNESVVYLVRKMYAFDPFLNDLLLQLSTVIVKYSLIVWVRWLSSEENFVADCLSREFPISKNHVQQFKLLKNVSV